MAPLRPGNGRKVARFPVMRVAFALRARFVRAVDRIEFRLGRRWTAGLLRARVGMGLRDGVPWFHWSFSWPSSWPPVAMRRRS